MAIAWESRAKLLTITEAAVVLHVHENTLRRWCDSGVIPAFRIGSRGDRRLLERDVYNLLSHMTGNKGFSHSGLSQSR